MTPAREVVAMEASQQGTQLCHSISDHTDDWLSEIFAGATADLSSRDRCALLAVGGYGRRELAPFSDLDVVLIHDKVKRIDEVASKMWYPIWDAGMKLGHAVRTPKETLTMCQSDLDTATAHVTARFVAGDESLANEVLSSVRDNWKRKGQDWLRVLHKRVLERHEAAGEVAFLLEPNLKEGVGGLRDIHMLWWAIEAGLVLSEDDVSALQRCNEVLLSARTALHQHAKRMGDVLRLEQQHAVAALLNYENDDALMKAISSSALRVSWIADEAWARLDPPASARSTPQPLASGIELVHGEIRLTDDVDPASDPTLVLRVAAAAARQRARIERRTLDRLGERCEPFSDPWPTGASDDLVALLLEGDAAIPVFEALDQRNLISRILPEWESVRCKPQRNQFHRYTVDRHLWQAAANAAQLVEHVSRPDLLVLGALFHDIGKGYPGDHTDVGMEMLQRIGPRMGLNESDTEIIVLMIQHHLLLPDVATRRDLSDDATITMVADSVKTPLNLSLLHALTQADSKATGPSAWSDWKAGLVNDLVRRVQHVLGGGDVSEVTWRLFPSAEVLEFMAKREITVVTSDDRVTVVSPDRPGTFSRVAAVLALSNLDVLTGEAHSDEQGMAASEFRVLPLYDAVIDWTPIVANIHKALRGELALEARLAERARSAPSKKYLSAKKPDPPSVRFFDNASSNATVLEIRAPDSVGLLHRVAKTLADLSLDIRHARVQTLGNEVVDTFYVRTQMGNKVTDPDHRREIERALLHAAS
jgi:[protein-PII] uridylyltransferase